jgi:hypothetical protein
MARDGAGQIAAVSCEVADAASGDLLRTATVRPRIRMATIAGLDPWTRTALRQTLRRLLRAAVDGEASGRA